MSEETLTPTPPEPDQSISASAPEPIQLALPDIEAMIREVVAAATAGMSQQVPAGGNTPYLFDADALPTSEKIRRGLALRSPR